MAGRPARSTSPADRFDASVFDHAVLDHAEALGKHLLVHFDGTPLSLHAHLVMAGRWSIRKHTRALDGDYPRTEPPIKAVVDWRLLSSTHHAELTDAAICEVLDPDGVARLRDRLGADPLRDDADPETALRRISRSRRTIGELIVDQSIIAGVGNVYRAELLYRARLDPFCPGNQIPPGRLDRLWADTVDLMAVGLGAGWIVTDPEQLHQARDALLRGERVPRWPKRYAVYNRAGRACLQCGERIRAERLGRQRIFWCPRCQSGGDDGPGLVAAVPNRTPAMSSGDTGV